MHGSLSCVRAGLAALLLGASAVATAQDTVWFVVAEREPQRGETFLLPLSDPEDIAEARARVAEGDASGVGSIVGARIAAGGDGFNRDVQAEGAPPWSWRITAFEGFADIAIELCDGWPGFVEADPAAFIANTGGRICFWGYTVVAELESAPAFAIGEGLDGAWYDPATSGQGFFVDVLADRGQLALGWYTYAMGAPTGGGDGHRWYTGVGDYAGASATPALFLSRGGAFVDPQPVQTESVGAAQLQFHDCDHATLHYRFDAGGEAEIALQRVAARPGCVLR
ncbi:MAG TPA: hypothetical protein VFG21_06000 [Xanthomonadaceae bacterium]|nr:hypothetical protein [Xanthomonadaceae bacterium]